MYMCVQVCVVNLHMALTPVAILSNTLIRHDYHNCQPNAHLTYDNCMPWSSYGHGLDASWSIVSGTCCCYLVCEQTVQYCEH